MCERTIQSKSNCCNDASYKALCCCQKKILMLSKEEKHQLLTQELNKKKHEISQIENKITELGI